MRAFGLSSLALLVAAQSVSAFNYTIGVGRDPVVGPNLGVGFNPSRTVTRANNDLLVFIFLAGQHRLVQTSLENPCSPSSDFDSGLQTIPANVSEFAQSPYQTTFQVANTSIVAYFADIGPAEINGTATAGTKCEQGAVFCVNTNEGGDRSCAQMLNNALQLGSAAGVATSSRPPYTMSSSTSSSMSSSQTSMSQSSRSASGTAPPAQTSQPSGAQGRTIGAIGALLAGAAGFACLLA